MKLNEISHQYGTGGIPLQWVSDRTHEKCSISIVLFNWQPRSLINLGFNYRHLLKYNQ